MCAMSTSTAVYCSTILEHDSYRTVLRSSGVGMASVAVSLPPVNSTTIIVGSSPILYPRLQRLNVPPKADIAQLPPLSNFTMYHAHFGRTLARARNMGRLNVVVLGASVTMGCGACDFGVSHFPEVSQSDRRHGCPTSHTRSYCDLAMSWVRQFQDELNDLWLAGALPVQPSTTVWARNAVGANFFASCPELHVTDIANSHLVLIEIASNLFDGSLHKLLERLRCAAPEAAFAFVAWPQLSNVPRYAALKEIETAAAQADADVYDVASAIERLGIVRKRFYAQLGLDNVHPNALGHHVLGRLAARFVVGSLSRQSDPTLREPPRAAAVGRCSSRWERCLDHRMPLFEPATTFQLVDEGAHKGVHKYGWRSAVPGGRLVVGPLDGPPMLANRTCGLLEVRLLYLASAVRSGLPVPLVPGELVVTCSGCECFPEQTAQKPSPFPRISTDINHGRVGPVLNMSVSRSATFHAIWHVTKPCLLAITHASNTNERGSTARGHNIVNSTVRIDGLSYREESMLNFAVEMHSKKRSPQGTQMVERMATCARDFLRAQCTARLHSRSVSNRSKSALFCLRHQQLYL